MTTPHHPALSPAVAENLLQLLATDDAFRQTFVADPRAALATLGHELPDCPNPPCLKVETLASKEEFSQAREQLVDHLTSVAGLTVVFCYEAGKIDQATAS